MREFNSHPTLAFSCGARSAFRLKEPSYLRSTLSRRQLQGFVELRRTMHSSITRLPMVFKRISEALFANAIACLRNTKDLFRMAKETTRSTTPKRLLLPESACLKLADAINRIIRRMR